MTPEQIEALRVAAERASPGPWVHTQFGVLKAGKFAEYTNGSAQEQIGMMCGASWMRDGEHHANADYVALANPAAIRALIAKVESPMATQWVSVADRLPPIGQEVIVWVPGGRVPVTALMRLTRWEGSTDFYWDNAYPGKGNMHIGTSITHWMPLPAAPTVPAMLGTKEAES